MNPGLAVFVLLDAGLLALWAAAAALTGRRPGPGLVGGLVLLELTAVVQAALDGLALLGGRQVAEPATHAGYLVASVLLLPLLLAVSRPAERAREPGWDLAVIAVACVALAVVDLRLIATGPAPPFAGRGGG